ncbi:WhiB family transcriptional regulator [Streptomyces sp. NPDC060085]|uniref:WhiB family transcriptional regulator n=1 Tax=Streptomyces sp. NPDC060085 TaxID=3347054 RepID=UPI00365C980A
MESLRKLHFAAVEYSDDHWEESAACRIASIDPELFFERTSGVQGRWATKAKAICNTCPVVHACLEAALVHEERFGVWGGLTPWERHVHHGGPKPRMRRSIDMPPEEDEKAL